MARGKKTRYRTSKQIRMEYKKIDLIKEELVKKPEEKCASRVNTLFRSDEIQEICALLNVDELGDQHCFLGAILIGKYDVVKKLLKEGYSLDSMDENRETALMLAVKHFRLPMVDFLVSRGADISLVDGEGNTALLLAAQSSAWDQDSFSGLWQSLRDHPKLRPDHVNKAGYCLLHYVTKRQWRAVLELILLTPLSLNCCTNKGVTALIMAASRGDYTFVKALLEAGADITIEDQQKCTALCYAIAFNQQKSETDPNKALELMMAAINDEHSKLTLESYLQRRLQLLVNPPRGSRAEFCKTVSSVLIHVLTFFARSIYSGMDLLIDLSVFNKLKEALEKHLDDPQYTTALLGVILELVKHCDCCCQGLSQTELADMFFTEGLGKCCLDILLRNGLCKTAIIKAVILLLLHMCTSESYAARTWLEANHEILQQYYNKYMRAFPTLFLDSSGDPHLETVKQRSLSFQAIMSTLKTKGWIVTKKEHAKANQKMKEEMVLGHNVFKSTKPNNASNFYKRFPMQMLNFTRTKEKSKPTVYDSVIRYNFGKLEIDKTVKNATNVHKPEKYMTPNKKRDFSGYSGPTIKPFKEKKPRLAIKEIQEAWNWATSQDENSEIMNNLVLKNNLPPSKEKLSGIKSASNSDPQKTVSPKQEIKQDQFSEGYFLFQMEDELHSACGMEEENNLSNNTSFEWLETYVGEGNKTVSDTEVANPVNCLQEDNNLSNNTSFEWLETYVGEGNKTVSDTEVANTMHYLQDIFNKIIGRYESTWQRQFQEGYIGFQGDSEDLLKLMKVLPALENYYIEKLMLKWNTFCQNIKDHARKDHVVYAAMVSEMQTFLLEFECKLDQKNIKSLNADESSSDDLYIDTENVIKDYRNGISFLQREYGDLFLDEVNYNVTESETLDAKEVVVQVSSISEDHVVDNKDAVTNSISGYVSSDEIDDDGNLTKSIWDAKVIDIESQHKNSGSGIINANENQNYQKPIEKVKNMQAENNNLEGDTDNTICESHMIKTDKFENMENKVHDLLIVTTPENIIKEYTSLESNKSTQMSKPPPGFENINILDICFNNLNSVMTYCGTKFQDPCLDLINLPTCKTELLAKGAVRLASSEFQADFKLFNGYNFGDIELGISSSGMPLAVRRFQKFNTLCNKTIVEQLESSVRGMLELRNDHVLPYLSYHDLPSCVMIVMPLCTQDLGQCVQQLRATMLKNPDCLSKISPRFILMANQVMNGLHFLHTQKPFVVHGNLKPSNVLVDANGSLRLSEFGLYKMLYKQTLPVLTSMIWWSQECFNQYSKYLQLQCSKQSDIQSAGMLLHYILTLGLHPHGQSLTDIIKNIKEGKVTLASTNVLANDIIYWMLSHEPENRPTTFQVLRHLIFWSNDKKWNFLKTCSGNGLHCETCPLPFDNLFADLDLLGSMRDINSSWISILKQYWSEVIGNAFEDKPSGLLRFLKKNLDNWTEDKDIFLELFPVLPLNLYRLLEQTIWIDHPDFEIFTTINQHS